MIRLLRWATPALALFSVCNHSACNQASDAASVAAILHRRPADFLRQLSDLDALASGESALPESAAPPALAETLSRQAERLKPRLAAAGSDSEKAALLTAWIFDSLGIVPVPEDSTLSASLPSRVFALRRGSCLGLSLVYLALGQELNLPFVPVFLPGHVFVRFHSPHYIRNVETLRKGLARPDSFYRGNFSLARRPWYTLQDAKPAQALGALIFNLGNAHRARGDWKTAAEEYRLAEEILPGFPEALGNQGAALLRAGHPEAAEEKLEAALAGDSLATPARKNLALIRRIEGNP